MAASRCFIFMYFLLPHWVPATWRSRAQTSIRAELPSGKLPTTRVRRRISRLSRSMTLLVADKGYQILLFIPFLKFTRFFD